MTYLVTFHKHTTIEANMPKTNTNSVMLDRFRVTSIATIANVMLKFGFKNVVLRGLSPLDPSLERMVGSAYTLRFIPSREDLDNMDNYGLEDNLHRRAIEECPTDSVLVIDAGGNCSASSAGDVMVARLKYRGVAGIVTDGGFRDNSGVRASNLPAYQVATATSATPIALHPIDLDVPISCAGVSVYPGDIIVGDADGVVVVPAHLAEEVSEIAYEIAQYEVFVDLMISKGRPIFGLFPATQESKLEFNAWVASGKPED